VSDPSAGAPAPGGGQRGAFMRGGLLAGFGAYLIWGLFPAYLKPIAQVPALEVVAHRVIWSVPFGALVLAVLKQRREALAAAAKPAVLARLALSAALISANWLLYVWAVAHDRVLEASLGYYVNPLIFITMGVVLLGEKLNRVQIIAALLAAIGVLVLTIGAGVFPWVSLLLAFSFSSYGVVRKLTPVGSMPGLFIETLILAPIAAVILGRAMSRGEAAFGAGSLPTDLLLLAAGPITVIPLALFALAARRLRLSTLGFLQYIGPTLQFALGLYYGEAFTLAHGICFALIWTALALISIDAVRRNRPASAAPVTQTAAASPKS
jgi:chloramphenicol-sensitive protein RarD